MAGASRQPVARSKLVPAPLHDGLVARPRVVDLFSTDHPFTLVSGLPGYGKTVAVRQWVETLDSPVAWLTVDLLDEEPVAFWSHLVAALRSVAPGIDDEPAMLLVERGADDRVFLTALIEQLTALPPPVVLVLDGLSGHVDNRTIEGLSLLVERAQDTLRVVATTHADPAYPLGRWRARGWLNEIREDVLRLTDAEAIAIAHQSRSAIRADADVADLNRRVDGWPIALHMALLSRPASDGGGPNGFAPESDRLLATYLAGELLAVMDEHDRDVALSLSVLRMFDPDMCNDLIGPDAADVVRRLLRQGMFLSVVDPRIATMRFHNLFRELLETELGWRDPARRIELHRRAATLWAERGDLDDPDL